MRTPTRKLALVFAVLAATAGFAGDSAPFLLDTTEGMRIAAEGEAISIAYSPRWGNAASCTIDLGGVRSVETNEGTATWVPTVPGVHTLTYKAGGLVYTAQFVVPPTLSVTDVAFRQRYPWNGLVDIDCKVNCSDPATNISLYVSARDIAGSKPLAVRSVWLESDATHTNALEVKSGTHRLVWDAGKDNPNFSGDAVTVDVMAMPCTGLYLVIDLSGGKDAASYPVSFLDAVPQGGWTDEYKTTRLVLRRIQSGEFTMGSPSWEMGRDSNEKQHEVTIVEPFYIGVFEVTQKQYELVTGSRPSSSIGDARPVECVSWNGIRGDSSTYNWPSSANVDSTTFMGKLRAKTGITTFDLPTEAVWEYACRAGTTTALNSGKNLTNTRSDADMAKVGRYYYNWSDGKGGYSGHTTVGSYLPNAWGLYDMHGNVVEWCLDWFANVDSSPVTDPAGPVTGSVRVCRGGGYASYAEGCRSAFRSYSDPSRGEGKNMGGFRLCCSAGLQ